MNPSGKLPVFAFGLALFATGIWLRYDAGSLAIFKFNDSSIQDSDRLSAWIAISHSLLCLGGGLILLTAAAALFRPASTR